MKRPITITVSADEAAMLLEALDTGCDIYLQSARDAGTDGSHDLAVVLGIAADRFCACRTRLARLLDVPGRPR